MSLFDKKGIALSAGFDYQAEDPLDSRFISKTIEEMNRLITEHAVYPNLFTFCLEDNTLYKYDVTTNTFIKANSEEMAKYEELLEALNKEIQDRTNADAEITANLETEKAERIAADENLQNQLDDLEANSVLDSDLVYDDGGFLSKVNTTKGQKSIRADRAIADNDGNIIIDTYATIVDHDALESKVDSEIATRTANDAAHDAAIQKNATDIANETARATEAEETLQANIDAEEEARTEADENLQTQLTAEVNRSTAKDTELEKRIATEESTRASADTEINKKINTINQTAFFSTKMSTDKQSIDFFNSENIKIGSVAIKDIGLQLTTDSTTGFIRLLDSVGNVLSEIDTHDEKIVKTATFDKETEELVITFYSGSVVRIPLSSMTDKIRYYFGDDETIVLDTSNPDKYTFKISDAYKALIAKIEPNEQRIVTLENGLQAEITRAKQAEATLQTNIYNEEEARTEADNTLQTNITNLTNTAVLDSEVATDDNDSIYQITIAGTEHLIRAEYAINDKDGNEISKTYATKTENGNLSSKLDSEIARSTAKDTEHDTKISQNATAIADEIERATTAEETLTANLNKEIQDRTTADNALNTSITAEKTRAEAAEQELDEKITAETTRATKAEETLQANIDAEKTRATQAEATLTTNLNKEIQDRTTADTALDEKITAETTRATNKESELQANIDNEKTDRIAADENLQTQLDEGLISNIIRYKNTNGADAIYGIQYTQNSQTITADILGFDSDYFDKNQLLNTNNLLTLNPTWISTLATKTDISGIIKDTSLTISENLVTAINNIQLFANKATNDSDGNPINTTYLKSLDASNTYIKKAGDTFTGNLTGSGNVSVTSAILNATSYLKTTLLTSESNANDILHSIKLGSVGNNKLTFNEVGGIFEFNHVSALTSENTNYAKNIFKISPEELVFSKDENKFNDDGTVADNTLTELLKVNETNIYYKGQPLALNADFDSYVTTEKFTTELNKKQNNLTAGKFISLDSSSKIEGRNLFPAYFFNSATASNFDNISAINTEYSYLPQLIANADSGYYVFTWGEKQTDGSFKYSSLTFKGTADSNTIQLVTPQLVIRDNAEENVITTTHNIYTKEYIDNTLVPNINGSIGTKQDKLTAGDNIRIENNVISAIDTTYSQATNTYLGINKFYSDVNKGTMIADDGAISPLGVKNYVQSLKYITADYLTENSYATQQWVLEKNYLQSIPDEYLTETEGDNRYWQKTDIPDHVVTTNTAQNIYGEKSFNNGISIAANNETETLSASDKVKMTYNATKKCLQFMFS